MTYVVWALMCVVMVCSGVSNSAVTYVSVTSTLNIIPHDKSSTMYLQWRVRKTRHSGKTVYSSLGRFVSPVDGRVLGNNMYRIEKRSDSQSVTLNESLAVPKQVVQLASQLKLSNIIYERLFDDGRSRARGYLSIRVRNPADNVLAVRRMLLTFVGGSVQKNIRKGQRISALAEVWLSSGGNLKARWLIADEKIPDGKLEYQSFASVSTPVQSAVAVVIQSPELPTQKPGSYLLKLQIDEPASTGDPPLIRLIVTD